MSIPGIRQTHTFVTLELSPAAFEEIRDKLAAAGYQHAFHDEGLLIDMHGIAVAPERAAREVAADVSNLSETSYLPPSESSAADREAFAGYVKGSRPYHPHGVGIVPTEIPALVSGVTASGETPITMVNLHCRHCGRRWTDTLREFAHGRSKYCCGDRTTIPAA